jgi:hypothetical protein
MANPSSQQQGYGRLASLMSQGVTPMFKRFAEMNTQNLMVMQAELLHLDERLKSLYEERQSTAQGAQGTSVGVSVDTRNDEIEDQVGC